MEKTLKSHSSEEDSGQIQKLNPILWKIIKLEKSISIDEVILAIREKGGHISHSAKLLLESSVFKKNIKPKIIKLYSISGAELGFTCATSRISIYQKALDLELKLCKADVGPLLRAFYPDQAVGESICIAMEPIFDSEFDCIFYIRNGTGEGQFLDAVIGDPDHLWAPEYSWIFCK